MIRFAETAPKFTPGTLVRHRRYGYRGLVVAVDDRCQASHEWYMSNRSQPELNQPWYHVLVHQSATTTYAAESNLVDDASEEPIDHPLIDEYFSFEPPARYLRNERPFVGW